MDGEGGGGDGGTFDAKYLKYIEAVLLIRNIYIYYMFITYFQDVYYRPNLERAVKGRYPLVLIKVWNM